MPVPHSASLPDDIAHALAEGRCEDPFAWLGPHGRGQARVIRAYLPSARAVEVIAHHSDLVLAKLAPQQLDGLYAGAVPGDAPYRLRIHWPEAIQETEDPYSYGLLLGDLDLHLFNEGRHYRLGHCLGAQLLRIGEVPGVRFAVWAPNARRVSVIGDFNSWDGRRHPMRRRGDSGVWELFIPRLSAGCLYQYEIRGAQGLLPRKADPLARQAEAAPGCASVVAGNQDYDWQDQDYLAQRAQRQSAQAPISIYELHAASWRRRWDPGRPSLQWDELGDQLIPYVQQLGFTHIELLPVMAHPFGGSWGYQPLGLFAPQASFGEPEAFKRFVDRCHQAGLGVILDWVPAHFPTDAHGLARFDGTALYEHEDPREGFHQDWNTLIYNLGRREVMGFMIASALHWLQEYHIDGLRVDAVASMLYRDYSRKSGEWVPNQYGGRENLENVAFLRELNRVVRQRCPGAIMIAEESTAWPGVSNDIEHGGLGFHYKWNMGWMHDSLRYAQRDPVHRRHHHRDLSFSLLYAFSERFVLPLSHDEVVHGKGSLINKMSGDEWQRFANLRTLFCWMWTHPGKKLLFMGGEFAQAREWNHDTELDWPLLAQAPNAGVQRLIGDLNRLYREEPGLHARDAQGDGFAWLSADDAAHSLYAYARYAQDAPAIVVLLNFTPVPRPGYRLGVPAAGSWRELLNSDSQHYGGSNLGNGGLLHSEAVPSHGQAQSLVLNLPPLAALILRHGS
ncbi:1,4-alpha-glucan branching enzyme [Solimonas aquatica]|uniref:1,4-alpha-glucan branching enzyme GlgB n=1 Tax=Solimonas aquatica TaxID=489703 RepID=A0A1H9DIP7_9GAMM|nr:1,4-alpha-glucan branching protein GlgB [Solimonas aquatica]SEQ13370.1 1,4-alpha-glucan branching enzyme [Solimonas aquatica]